MRNMGRYADEVLENAIGVLENCNKAFSEHGEKPTPFEVVKLAFLKELKEYRDICVSPEKLKLIDALYLERCEEINRLNKIIEALAKKLLNTEFGGCYMCKNPMKNITIDGVNNGCDGECNTTEKSSVEDFLKKFISELERMKEVAGC